LLDGLQLDGNNFFANEVHGAVNLAEAAAADFLDLEWSMQIGQYSIYINVVYLLILFINTSVMFAPGTKNLEQNPVAAD
jgi:hypothetical protein